MKKTTIILIALLVLSATNTFGQQNRVVFDPNYNGYYLLKNLFRGNNESLEGNGPNGRDMNGAAFMSTQQGAPTGQCWKFVPVSGQKGYYRLETMSFGNKRCLEGNAMNGETKNGAAFMDQYQNVTGQMWRIIDLGNGFYRLQTMSLGDEYSLEGNMIGGDRGGNAFMDKTQNVTGQIWYLVPVQ